MVTATQKERVGNELSQKEQLTVCVLDDEVAMIEMLQDQVERLGYGCLATTDPGEALEWIQRGRSRVILADMKMPAVTGLEFMERVLAADPGAHVILVTGHYSLEAAIDAIKRGAYDYLTKPIERARLKKTLDELAALYNQRRRIRELEEQLLRDLEQHGIVGKSPATLEMFDLARKIAKHYTNVLLTGPTGSGKDTSKSA